MSSTSDSSATELFWLDAGEIAARVASGEVSAAEVAAAHVQRIEEVNGRLNAVVVKCYERARREAREIDRRRVAGEPLGPLAGVPVSIKECFYVSGTPATIGVDRFAREIAEADSPLVRRWNRAGALVLAKTNVPQLMILHETDNPVYGRTNNPWNLERGSGGSSGGEAAILAAGGSALGLGSDLGGSIRQPAHSCGICGLLPTSGRIEVTGKRGNFCGMEALSLQPGPMARTVADLELGLRTLADPQHDAEEPRIAPVAWRDPARVDITRLRIGLVSTDGFFAPGPALRRAVDEAGQALASAGVTVEPFDLPDVPELVRLYFGLISADGAANLVRTLGGSPADWRIKRLLRIGRLPRRVRAVTTTLLRAAGQQGLADLIGWSGRRSADAYWQLVHARGEYTRRFCELLDRAQIDALVLPPHALPALKHGSSMHLPLAASYCFLANLLGMPAGVLPATRVRAGEESDRAASRDLVVRAAWHVEQGSAGLPVGVQVLARHWHEDVLLAVMRTIESGLRQRPMRPF